MSVWDKLGPALSYNGKEKKDQKDISEEAILESGTKKRKPSKVLAVPFTCEWPLRNAGCKSI